MAAADRDRTRCQAGVGRERECDHPEAVSNEAQLTLALPVVREREHRGEVAGAQIRHRHRGVRTPGRPRSASRDSLAQLASFSRMQIPSSL